jgi:prepilin-type N-terminal cleavage/methylation domain-containing protein
MDPVVVKLKKKNKSAGFSLIEVLIALALIGTVALGVTSLGVYIDKFSGMPKAYLRLINLRSYVISHLKDESALIKTIYDLDNVSMACLRDSTDCAGQGDVFNLLNAAGQMVVKSSVGQGFSTQGAACSAPDNLMSTECPIRVELSWEPVCASILPPCLSPEMIKVKGRFYLKSPSIALDVSRYNFDLWLKFPLLPMSLVIKQLDVMSNTHGCAITVADKVNCWGLDNSFGQLGLGDTLDLPSRYKPSQALPFLDFGPGSSNQVIQIDVGVTHACALLKNGTVKCWGDNTYGQLGYEDTKPRGGIAATIPKNLPAIDLGTGRTAVAIAMAWYSSCAILDNGRVKCWGQAAAYGYESTLDLGGTPGTMGDSLPYVDLGPGLKAKVLEGGAATYCVILDNNFLKCWGGNVFGNLGLGDTMTRGDSVNQMGANLPYVDLGTGRTVKQVQVANGSCVTLDNGDVKCWGWKENVFGATQYIGDGPGEMGNNLSAIPLGGKAKQGDPLAGGLGACALMSDDRVKCWTDISPPAYLFFPGSVQTAKSINENCAILTDNSLYCW